MDLCPFCEIISTNSDRIIMRDENAVAIRDGFPLAEGHTLIIPTVHQSSFFSLSTEVQISLFRLLQAQRDELVKLGRSSDFNVGINDGPAAGQTVAHCHIHLIPRKFGDVSDPRGGVRWVIPTNADYWSKN